MIHFVDHTDLDIFDFGAHFVSRLLAKWFGGVNIDDEKYNKGTLHVKSDIKIETRRVLNPTELIITTFIDPVIIEQTRHCRTPIEAIALIGGLLFVLRVSFLIKYFHELYFEKKMRKIYANPTPSVDGQQQSTFKRINDSEVQANDDSIEVKNEGKKSGKWFKSDHYFKTLFSFETFHDLVERVNELEEQSTGA